ncbi:MAG: MoaD/ThiS family protein [Actinobacteria bacterium]|nr:MoaD/ThiS family protein [Actinomycetota bacterium]
MGIEVRVPTVLRKHTDGERRVSGDGDRLGELINDLGDRHNGLRDALVAHDGSLHRFINVYVNDEDVRFIDGIDTPLSDGDVVSILPAVAGG